MREACIVKTAPFEIFILFTLAGLGQLWALYPFQIYLAEGPGVMLRLFHFYRTEKAASILLKFLIGY